MVSTSSLSSAAVTEITPLFGSMLKLSRNSIGLTWNDTWKEQMNKQTTNNSTTECRWRCRTRMKLVGRLWIKVCSYWLWVMEMYSKVEVTGYRTCSYAVNNRLIDSCVSILGFYSIWKDFWEVSHLRGWREVFSRQWFLTEFDVGCYSFSSPHIRCEKIRPQQPALSLSFLLCHKKTIIFCIYPAIPSKAF